jgi:hypothetical protein
MAVSVIEIHTDHRAQMPIVGDPGRDAERLNLG